MNLKFVPILLLVLAFGNLAFGTDIFDAIKDGDLETVKSLLKDNPDLVCVAGKAGMTPLHWAAARFNRKKMAQLLLANKADIEAKDKIGRTPLHFAVFIGDRDMTEMLIQSNANVDAGRGDGSTPLMIAAGNGNKGIAEFLLEKNATVDLKDGSGKSALRHAVEAHHIEIAELLLVHNADVNTRDNSGFTPLDYAARTNMAKLLLANKADVNARNDRGTPLHLAAYRKSKDVSEMLIASNADVNARDKRGDTPLHVAVQRESIAVVELLIASNADVNAKDNNGNTPLQFGFHNKDIAALLRQHGGHGNENTNEPLAGWYFDGDADSPHAKAILDDYQAYAHEVFPKDRSFFIAEVNFYEDGTGRHAVRIELEPDLREYKEYYLIYDRNNVRVKVIKGKTWRQFHI